MGSLDTRSREGRIPDWLAEILDERCPGFLQTEIELTPKAAKSRPLPIRLEDWIDEHIFGFAKQEGWFNAIAFYAIREPRYQRAEVCWSECVERWKKAKPTQYPSFDEWKDAAAHCDDTAHLLPDECKARASAKLVAPDRLATAVSRWIDWEALASWARAALESKSELPTEVVSEIERRCPGFIKANGATGKRDFAVQRKTGTVSCLGSLTNISRTQKLKAGSMPFLSRREFIRGRFGRWNMPTTAMKSGVQQCLSLTRLLRTGAEKLTLLLTWTTERSS